MPIQVKQEVVVERLKVRDFFVFTRHGRDPRHGVILKTNIYETESACDDEAQVFVNGSNSRYNNSTTVQRSTLAEYIGSRAKLPDELMREGLELCLDCEGRGFQGTVQIGTRNKDGLRVFSTETKSCELCKGNLFVTPADNADWKSKHPEPEEDDDDDDDDE